MAGAEVKQAVGKLKDVVTGGGDEATEMSHRRQDEAT